MYKCIFGLGVEGRCGLGVGVVYIEVNPIMFRFICLYTLAVIMGCVKGGSLR